MWSFVQFDFRFDHSTLNFFKRNIIVFFLFQTPKDFRRLLLFIDPSLNTPITEQSYGDHCAIYDENNPEDPYHNIKGNYRLFLRLLYFCGYGWLLSTCMRMIFLFQWPQIRLNSENFQNSNF